MEAQSSTNWRQVLSDSGIDLDAWLNLANIMRERRNRLLGADMFHDPSWAIVLVLGRDVHADGVALDQIARDSGSSPQITARWLDIMIARGLVEELPEKRFIISTGGREKLRQVYS